MNSIDFRLNLPKSLYDDKKLRRKVVWSPRKNVFYVDCAYAKSVTGAIKDGTFLPRMCQIEWEVYNKFGMKTHRGLNLKPGENIETEHRYSRVGYRHPYGRCHINAAKPFTFVFDDPRTYLYGIDKRLIRPIYGRVVVTAWIHGDVVATGSLVLHICSTDRMIELWATRKRTRANRILMLLAWKHEPSSLPSLLPMEVIAMIFEYACVG